jgi:hypothetical protein
MGTRGLHWNLQGMERKLLVLLLVTTPVLAEVATTENLINDLDWTESGSIINHYNHHHTDWMGGSVSQTIDLSQYEGQISYNYNTMVSACENRIGGDCSSGTLDTFTVTLTLDTGETWSDTFNVGNYWQEIDLTYIPLTDATSATLDLYGQDDGYWGGWYGPVFYSGDFKVTYDPTLIAVILPATEDPTLQTTVMDNVYNPEVAAPQVTPQEAPQSPQEASSSPDPQPQAESPSESPSEPSGGTQEQPKAKDSPKSEGGTQMATIIDVTTASMESLPGNPSDPLTQVLALVVMSSQGVEIEDVKLNQPELPKGPIIQDNRRFADRMWMNALVSDAKFDKYMVEAQWQN